MFVVIDFGFVPRTQPSSFIRNKGHKLPFTPTTTNSPHTLAYTQFVFCLSLIETTQNIHTHTLTPYTHTYTHTYISIHYGSSITSPLCRPHLNCRNRRC